MDAEETREGWQVFKRYDQRRYHYIVGSRSLCLKLAFYTDEVSQAKPGHPRQTEDCAECYKRLAKREARRER